MLRPTHTLVLLLFFAATVLAQDSLRTDSTDAVSPNLQFGAGGLRTDTIFVIPAGPIAGSFTSAARLVVADTVAGWAHIQVEGWVPVGAVLDRLSTQDLAPAKTSTLGKIFGTSKSSVPPRQCEAITRKGTRCSRNAQKGTPYCWQHQKR